jgi:hypothetical protein
MNITITEAKEKFKCREDHQILLDKEKRIIWDIEGLEHDYGKWNGEPTTLWLEMPDGNLEPYIRNGVHRICWEINYKQSNHSKWKWDSLSIRRSGRCSISANGKEVYSFMSSDLGYALSKAQSLIIEISEHPYNFLEQEKEKDRKIWYYNLPAKIRPSSNPGEISIQPDYTGEFKGKENHWKWWKEYHERSRYKSSYKEDDEMDEEHLEESREMGYINHGDALSDGNINWFRSEPEEN